MNGISWHLLVEKKSWLKTIAGWHYEQWGYLRPEQSLCDVEKIYQSRLSLNQLPITYILSFRNQAIGMFSLLQNTYDFFHDHKIPILNNVFILKPYRNINSFRLMLRQIDAVANHLNIKEICGFTINKKLNVLYTRLGCFQRGEGIFLNRKIFLFYRPILSQSY